MSRNGLMLKGRLRKRGYDWWWHSFTGVSRKTGEREPFFIEYYLINPDLSPAQAVFGQHPESRKNNLKPSYAMIKAGAWGPDAVQLHGFYPAAECHASFDEMKVQTGKNLATETLLKGSVTVTAEEAKNHPEWMCGAGSMSWDLSAEKVLSYSVGYGAGALMRLLGAFRMYWHVAGMFTRYSGTVIFNGESFDVEKDTSYGYQDKNWGTDYTNPWIWLNCNHFRSRLTGREMALTSLDVGGGRPVVFGLPLMKKILAAFYYEGTLYEYNFSKFWIPGRQEFDCQITGDRVVWKIRAENPVSRIEADFSCPKEWMLKVNYENPDGEHHHRDLWNGGHASGELKFYRREKGAWVLKDHLEGDSGGCEYGEYRE